MKLSPTVLILSGLAIFSTLCCAGVFQFSRQQYSTQEASANEFATPIILAYLRSWDGNVLLAAGSKQFRSGTPDEILTVWTKKFRTELGRPTKVMPGNLAGMNTQFGPSRGTSLLKLEYPAEFEFGPATIVVTIIREEGAWKLHQLYINSPVFDEDASSGAK